MASGIYEKIKKRIELPEAEKKKMLEEATGVSEWIYAVIRKVCAELQIKDRERSVEENKNKIKIHNNFIMKQMIRF